MSMHPIAADCSPDAAASIQARIVDLRTMQSHLRSQLVVQPSIDRIAELRLHGRIAAHERTIERLSTLLTLAQEA